LGKHAQYFPDSICILGSEATNMTRQIIFHYNGQLDEEIVNVSGEVETPEPGDTIEGHGKEWRVHSTLRVGPNTKPPTRPAFKVFLVDQQEGQQKNLAYDIAVKLHTRKSDPPPLSSLWMPSSYPTSSKLGAADSA
jgi:hypothetical protein